MSTAATTQGVPSRETILEQAREGISRFQEMNKALGGMFTQAQAALLLGLGKSRVGQLVQEGRFRLYEFTVDSEVIGRYISGADIERYLAHEQKPAGRPSKLRFLAAAVDTK